MTVLLDCENKLNYQTFLKVDVVRDLKKIKLINKKQRLICKSVNGSINHYLNELEAYESSKFYKYKENTTYEVRRGILLTILLPKNEWSMPDLRKLIAKYVRYIVQEERGLKYIAWEYIKGKAKYISLYIADRESYYHEVIKKYKKDVYINKITKAICKKDDELAVLKCKKGDFIKDKNGNVIKEIHYFKERKSRRFIYKESQFNAWIEQFKELYLQALKLFKNMINFEYGKYFRRLNLRFAYNRFQRRIIKETNLVIQYIQNELNYKLRQFVRYPNEYEVYTQGYLANELIQEKKADKILSLFEHYRSIFKKKKFMFNDYEYLIGDCRVDKAEENLVLLKTMFKNELKSCLEIV